MSIFGKLFQTKETDEIADLRRPLGALVRRCLDSGADGLDLKVWRCKLRGEPVGSWRVTIERIADDEKEPK